MLITVPAEPEERERRIALVPDDVKRLLGLGAEVAVETGLGARSGFADAEYQEAGAKLVASRAELLSAADIVLRVGKPHREDVDQLRAGAIHISYLDPFNELELVNHLAAKEIRAISMEMIPRTTLAQKMDALSSQANLGGYVAVILAARKSDKILPMMMTPAGTIPPARLFVIGAGVAGLQAIATAKRLGARVEAFDTRPIVEEQVQSLGAKFVKIDLGDTGQTKDGYATQLTDEQLEMQKVGMKAIMSQMDIVITTAQVFGRPAPRIVSDDMVRAMKPGSVIVDMAVETGGNVEGSVLDEEVDVSGVTIIGLGNLPGEVAMNASQMYSANLFNLVDSFWDKESNTLDLDTDNEIIKGCLITDGGQIVNETVRGLVTTQA